MKREKGLRRFNRERRARLFKAQFGSGARVKWMRALPCCACGGGPCEVHHVRSRGAGGGADDTVPLCSVCHRLLHTEGAKTFSRRLFLDLSELATKYAQDWRARESQ